MARGIIFKDNGISSLRGILLNLIYIGLIQNSVWISGYF